VSVESTVQSRIPLDPISVDKPPFIAEDGNAAFRFWHRVSGRKVSGRTALALQGSAWTIVEYVTTQLLRTVATLVLARHYLSPETFGIVGLATVFISGLAMFSELGIVINIVQHPRGDDPEFLNTAFSIQAARGCILWMVAAVAAYPLTRFYHQPELGVLLVVAALSEIIRGMTSTAAWTLKRHLRLRKIALLAISAELMAFVVGVILAMASPSPWALVGRTLTSAAVYAIGSHFVAGHAVSFRWNRSVANDILKFGGWISLSTAAYFLAGQGERLILGKFVTAAELGCFSLALVIVTAPAAAVGQLVNQIFLPMISASVRANRRETVGDFMHARRMFFLIALFAAVGFLAFANPFVRLVLNPEYRMTGWMVQALGLRVAMDLFTAPASSLILACGQSRYAAMGNTTRFILMIAGIWISFALFGIREAVISLIIAQALSFFPLILGLRKLLPSVGRSELRWYVGFLVLLALATLVPWPAA
jgi:O-antigen/teichoic acid export membrane protein